MRKPSAVIGEALTLLEPFNNPKPERWFLCHIIRDHFPADEAKEACELIRERLAPHSTLCGMLSATADDYPCFEFSSAFEYRYQWWLSFVEELEQKDS